MDCYQCGEELMWGGDHDCEEGEGAIEDEHSIVSNFTCPNCDSFTLVYHSKE